MEDAYTNRNRTAGFAALKKLHSEKDLMKTSPAVIAIDGPASAGKSTLGKKLAENLGYLFFDTGCLYRAVTLCALKRGIPVTDSEAISRLAAALDIQVTHPEVHDGRQYTVMVDKIDITWELRSPETDASVSIVSTFPGVRKTLTERMRERSNGRT